jgi:hypothetical protein
MRLADRARPCDGEGAMRSTSPTGPRKRAPSAAASITIRYAGPADAAALERLAQLEAEALTGGPMLVAQVGEELWAAVELDGPQALADPFRPSGELLLTVAGRAAQIRRAHDAALRPSRPARLLRRLRPRRLA